MFFRAFTSEALSHYSYLVGCQATGEAVVIDPARDVEPYLAAAEAEGLRIVAVTETHIHADYLSGARELAGRTAARLYLSDEGDADWKYSWAPQAIKLKDGAEIWVGKVRLQVVATPGHTPEHIAFLLTDTAASPEPLGMFTGDFLFVGDVGRPDLLERAAGFQGTMEKGARALYRSLANLSGLPDHLLIWPAHGAGSACGKGLGAVPHTTLGYQRRVNWALQAQDESSFVQSVLSGQPEPPRYFAMMKKLNKEGPALLSERPHPPLLAATRLEEILAEGALVLDLRPAGQFSTRFLPGTINIPLNKSFSTWAGWLVPYDQDLYLITDRVEEARRELASIGLDRIAGVFRPSAVEQLPRQARIPRVAADELPPQVRVLDVRTERERGEKHVAGSLHLPLAELEARISELNGDRRPLAVHCRSGARSAIAASLLHRHGFHDVLDLGAYPEGLRQPTMA